MLENVNVIENELSSFLKNNLDFDNDVELFEQGDEVGFADLSDDGKVVVSFDKQTRVVTSYHEVPLPVDLFIKVLSFLNKNY